MMKTGKVAVSKFTFPVVSLNTLIVGSGAAALNAAVTLWDLGQREIAIATEDFGGGTSNNSGSDKQTYYKLSLAGNEPDSPYDMARDLFAGGGMHGDIALCEALGSARAFFRLVDLGVPFPYDRYGAYVGYKTDHDPRQRATSAGPLTSHLMFEALAREARRKRIRIFDRHQVIALLTAGPENEKKVVGAVAIDKDKAKGARPEFVIFNAVNVVLGSGGPAGIYKTSVYPATQTGSHGMAFAAGAAGQNLGESQFGLASLKFRWNLSGTFQQAIPRYVSTDPKGLDEKEFLNACFPDMGKLATAIFLKGYQWPFDPRKAVGHGSSLIDILVYRETEVKGRRVFLDYRRNPGGGGRLGDFSFEALSPEAYSYLEKSGALLPTPIERLKKMNPPAIEIYRNHGIDLDHDTLEIAVCAQHNNGGLKGDIWWESNIRHLFPVGEVNGTHGIYRPGGSALNSGQVGSRRASQFIARRYGNDPPAVREFWNSAGSQVQAIVEQGLNMIDKKAKSTLLEKALDEIRSRMSAYGAHVRYPEKIADEAEKAWALYSRIKRAAKVRSARDVAFSYKIIDLCLTHALYLEAIKEYIERGGASRGSYLVLDPNGEKPCPELDDSWRFKLASPDALVSRKILEISLEAKGRVKKEWVDIRTIPDDEAWFENVWSDFRAGRAIGGGHE